MVLKHSFTYHTEIVHNPPAREDPFGRSTASANVHCTADLGVHTWLLLHVHPHGAPKTGLVTKAADISPTVTEYEALFEAVKYAVLPHLTRTTLGE